MSGPARRLALRSSLVALLAFSLGQNLSSRQTPSPSSPDRQQNPPPATGMILGQVVDASTGRPLAGALVSLTSSPLAAAAGPVNAADVIELAATQTPNVPTRVIADGEGRFVFRALAKGRYSFSASAPGYLVGGYGQRRAGGPTLPLELETGEKVLDAVFRMWKSATISGTVLDEAGEPVIGASVRTLRRGIVAGRTRWTLSLAATTDDRGMYRISGLQPGDYSVALMSSTSSLPAATVDAYREAIQSSPGGSPPLIRELQASGAPFPSFAGIRVGDQILQQSLGIARGAASPAPSEDGKILTYPTTYHPAATAAAEMTVITLASGEERSGIDLHLRLVPTFKVSGIVNGSDGPAPNMGVRLLPAGMDDFSSESGLEAAITATDARGAFIFLGVPAGAYTLKVLKTPRPELPTGLSEGMVMVSSGTSGIAFGTSLGPSTMPPAPLPTEPTLWGSLAVSVSEADVTGLNVTLRAGFRVTGRVEFEGTAAPPAADQLQRMSVTLQPLDARVAGIVTPGRVTPDSQFRTLGYPPGRYYVTAGGAGTNWTLKAAMLGGRDVSDEPLELGSEDVGGVVLVFTDKPSQLSGTVRNPQGQGDADADVVVFPANHQLWKEAVNPRRARSVRTAKTGVYTIQGLPPGDYYVVAIGSTSTRDWQDPKFLEAAAPLATRVTILIGDKKTQDLVTSRLR
jgi:protocatechuate 3,4-dioxygenase beta subunit